MDKIERNSLVEKLQQQGGAIGYLIAWMLGVPATVLLVIFLLRGG